MRSDWNNVKLGDIAYISSEKVNVSNLTLESYVSTDNMLPERDGIEQAAKFPSTSKVNRFLPGDVLFSNIRPYFKKVWQANFIGGASPDVLVWRSKDNSVLTQDFLHCILTSDEFIDFSVRTSKGVKMPRGDKDAMLGFELPLPPKEYQEKVSHIWRTLMSTTGEN